MESAGAIAEAISEVGEVALRKLMTRPHDFAGEKPRGTVCRGVDATRTSEAIMEGFNETDAANLQRVKDAMAERAVGGGLVSSPDAAAAAAFAQLLDAETRRAELALKSTTRDKAPAASPSGSWTESVTGRQAGAEMVASAA